VAFGCGLAGDWRCVWAKLVLVRAIRTNKAATVARVMTFMAHPFSALYVVAGFLFGCESQMRLRTKADAQVSSPMRCHYTSIPVFPRDNSGIKT
jgi:hypothetical protein